MKRSEIFSIILDVVCGCIEVDPSEVLNPNRKEDAVMAKSLIATYCIDYGMRVHHIQEYLHFKSHTSVRYLLDMYEQRKKVDRHYRFFANTTAHELDKTMAQYGL